MSQKRALNLLLVSAYTLVILFLHDPIVNLSVLVMNYFTRQTYDVLVAATAVLLLAGIACYFVAKLAETQHAIELKIGYLTAMVSLLFLHTQIHFVMNIELIHAAEFGIMALLIFPLTQKFGDTAFYTVLLGALDEWVQYQILYPEKSDYYDFNDLVTNLLGAGLALVLLYSAGVNNKSYPPKTHWYKSPAFYVAAVLAVFYAVLYRLSLIQTYAGNDSNAWFVLNKSEGKEAYWRNLTGSEIVYHVLQPLEGFLLLVALLLLFYALDFFARKQLNAPRAAYKNQRIVGSVC